ncbi:MaoC family dehydratase [Arthrobacter castelli]|uniref:MaoC family dehydratase n=1 Tax=Arthrobacter castelli TaxID=271431 RepID=UPI0004013C53|nr:MaoC family dehydratase [Arthrobacter castelli]
MTTTVSFEELPSLAGKDLGYTDYREITQEQVDTFADAADDHQWIHTDPQKAKDGPFGAPIAHGYLTLSMTIPFWTELLDVTGVSTKVNYGLNKARFPSPVKVGSKVRMGATIADVEEVKGGMQITVDCSVEIEGETKPAVVSQAVHRFYA